MSWATDHKTAKSFLVGGFNPSKKYEFVSWDPNVPTHQPGFQGHVKGWLTFRAYP